MSLRKGNQIDFVVVLGASTDGNRRDQAGMEEMVGVLGYMTVTVHIWG